MKKYFILIIVLVIGIWTNIGCKKNSVVETPQLNPPKILSFAASPSTISYRESSVLTWEVSGATSVIADWTGAVGQIDSRTVTPEASKTYTITATNSDGTVTGSVEVNVKKEGHIVLVDGSLSYLYKSYGSCFCFGTVINDGNHPCYNVKITLYAYDSSDKIIESADGFPGSSATIQPGTKVNFEAIFWNLYNWGKVAKLSYETTWINSAGATVRKEGTINLK